MQAFKTLSSLVIPLAMDNVDTDMIIPAQYLTKVDKQGYGEHVFQRLREQDPDFVFNDPVYEDAAILLAGENFGCGSSREHAVWALLQAGIRVVIAKSYSDIFFNNSAKNGLLLVILGPSVIDEWLQQPSLRLRVDLEHQCVITPEGEVHTFDYDPFRKDCFLKGQDDLAYLLEATK
jgi:3-isopropylmalate/(R)-2-methylmalate dehydratase small subunit